MLYNYIYFDSFLTSDLKNRHVSRLFLTLSYPEDALKINEKNICTKILQNNSFCMDRWKFILTKKDFVRIENSNKRAGTGLDLGWISVNRWVRSCFRWISWASSKRRRSFFGIQLVQWPKRQKWRCFNVDQYPYPTRDVHRRDLKLLASGARFFI